MFTSNDKKQLQKLKISEEIANEQLRCLNEGCATLKLIKPAVLKEGILSLYESDVKANAKSYDKMRGTYKIKKFVPASGAATRMFKALYKYLGNSEKELDNDTKKAVDTLIKNCKNLPFYKDLADNLKNGGENIEDLMKSKKYDKIISGIVEEKGLGFGNLPKALIPFHLYPSGVRTAIEEQLHSGVLYCMQKDKNANFHFTLLPDHIKMVEELVQKTIETLETEYGCSISISYSVQEPHTDTIAVDNNGEPYRKEDGDILLRPGGHGALIENLNSLESDIVFISNIDNVPHERYLQMTVEYKKALAGILINYHKKISSFLHKLDRQSIKNDAFMMEVTYFIKNKLNFLPPKVFDKWEIEQQVKYLISILNKPLRVCGMVKNEGEPGGGPFWVENEDGSVGLQIVEEAQINMNDEKQKQILQSSTHFNPVDIVCFIKDMHNRKYDLTKYVNKKTGIISQKTYGDDDIKVLEHPGLWNGAMWDWNTVFVEVPVETFTPVKTINDLLRKEHQPG